MARQRERERERERESHSGEKNRESDLAKPGFGLAYSQYSSLDFHTL
jgi:hypothetical protein